MSDKATVSILSKEQALPDLLSTNRSVRRRAVRDLAASLKSGDASVQESLESLVHHSFFGTRFAAAYCLIASGQGSQGATAVILEALGADPDSRWAAAQLVRSAALGSEVLALLRVGTVVQRRLVAHCLRSTERPPMLTLVALCRLIEDPDPSVRSAVVAVLAPWFSYLQPISDAQPRLLRLLSDADQGVRRAVAARLSGVASSCATVREELLHIVDTTDDDSLRRAAARARRV